MSPLKTIAATAALVAFAFAAVLPARAGSDIVDTANKAGNFKTLVKAIEAAGLAKTLKGAGPFTVFAPNDEAFAKLPAGTVDDLLKPENKAKLESILKFHVVEGKLLSKNLAGKTKKTKSVQGAELAVDATKGVTIGNSKVVKPDIAASNGVIHAIDTVLMPPGA